MGPKRNCAGYFIMCLLGTLRGAVVQYLGFLFLVQSAEGQGGGCQRPRGLSSSRFWVTAHLAVSHGPAVLRVPALSPELGQLTGRSSGRWLALAGMGGNPRDLESFSCVRSSGFSPDSDGPATSWRDSARGLAPSKLGLGGLLTSGISVSSSGDGHGPRTAEQMK